MKKQTGGGGREFLNYNPNGKRIGRRLWRRLEQDTPCGDALNRTVMPTVVSISNV